MEHGSRPHGFVIRPAMTKINSPRDAARPQRLRAAPRENLKHRKAQVKARAGDGASDSDGDAPGAAGAEGEPHAEQ